MREANARLRDRVDRPLDRLILCTDADTEAGEDNPNVTGTQITSVLSLAHRHDAEAHAEGDEVVMDGGALRIALVRWEVAGETPVGVPQKQTLERLVCAAIQAAYPDRAEDVARWLAGRGDSGPKAFAWSYMAGWFAESGCDDFYRAIWRDAAIATELRQRLMAVWPVAEALAR